MEPQKQGIVIITLPKVHPACANCAVDDTPCEISRRKRRRNLDLQPSLAHASGNEEASSAASTSSFSRVPIALPPCDFCFAKVAVAVKETAFRSMLVTDVVRLS
ncbi:hypothetical protein HYQ46_000404 [Verticillium longisporum]|nr:hypothetical protein HYQ44_008888 [Verticillium longisporum]KAG7150646.1 hypothetical protein HYQ46_000404 [Verticillium longisporum]